MLIQALILATLAQPDPGFAKAQSSAPRVKAAKTARADRVRALFVDNGIPYPPRALLVRVFKRERALELWGAARRGDAMVLVKTFPICAASGTLGPKRREGDMQVPEGFYRVTRFNPYSSFHLSLGIDYPNASDRVFGQRARVPRLGGDIFIHGSCVTIGCVPIEDEPMEELYLAAVDTQAAGHGPIAVHIFPARLTDSALESLAKEHAERPDLVEFWTDLKPGFDAFESSKRAPVVRVDGKTGRYLVRPRPPLRRPAP